MRRRDAYIDILKAIGIISIVIGHSSGVILGKVYIGKFVYLYHIMIFFFVSGYCFKEEYGNVPHEYCARRLKNLYPLFVEYGFFFVLLHNLFIDCHIIGAEKYSINDIILKFSSVLLMKNTETLLAAFWFVPVLFFAASVFCFLFGIAEKMRYRKAAHIILVCLMGGTGIYCNSCNLHMEYHIHTAFLAIPVMYLGYWVKKNRDKVMALISVKGTVLAGIVLYCLASSGGGDIELSAERIFHPLLFYPITILGIYFCMGVASILMKNRIFRNTFAFIGENSFHIMALHFLAFKIVDVIYGHYINASVSEMVIFPKAFRLWPLYYVVGVFLPIGVIWVLKKLKIYIKTAVTVNN